MTHFKYFHYYRYRNHHYFPLLLFVILLLLSTLSISSCSGLKKITRGHDAPLLPLATTEKSSDHKDSASKIIIVSQCPYASEAALDIFQRGGNIFDAATALAFTLAVTSPHKITLGGGGMALFATPEMEAPLALDFEEKSSNKALKEEAKENDATYSFNSDVIGIPGMVSGILEIHSKYGQLPLEEVLQKAMALARHGFPIYTELAESLQQNQDLLRLNEESKKIFFSHQHQQVLQENDLLVQSDLANSLQKIAKEGSKAFYQKSLAEKIVSSLKKKSSFLDEEDMLHYQAVFKRPLQSPFRQYEIYSMPLPSATGISLLEALNILQNESILDKGPSYADNIHLISSALWLSMEDSKKLQLGQDLPLITSSPFSILSPDYAESQQKSINLDKFNLVNDTKKAEEIILPQYEQSGTHFALMDIKGNIISITMSLNSPFGSGITIPETGILMNNHFYKQNGKRPFNHMAPTLVYFKKHPYLSMGTSGNPQAVSCLTEGLLNILAFKMPLYDAVAAIRYTPLIEEGKITLQVEEDLWSSSLINKLQEKAYQIKYAPIDCSLQTLMLYNGVLRGVSDPRTRGKALGL